MPLSKRLTAELFSIPVTNLSVNPARSTGPAVFLGGWALARLGLFRVAPTGGGLLADVVYRWPAVGAMEPVVGQPEPAVGVAGA